MTAGEMGPMERLEAFAAELETDLAVLEKQAEEIIKKRDELRSTINGLRKLIGRATSAGITNAYLAELQTKQDAIVDIIAAADGRFLSAREVEQRLEERGFKGTNYNSVVTFLSRLAKDGKIKNVKRHGYAINKDSVSSAHSQ